MDKELRGLVAEIFLIILFLIIVVPICVNASSEYRMKKDSVFLASKSSVDLSHYGDYKKIRVASGTDKVVKMGLIMKITKFNDDYLVSLDDKVYDLRELEYTEDENYQYYNLGVYEVEKNRTFLFKINVKDKSYYDETISYSFYTEGFM